MNKSQLIEAVSARSGLSKRASRAALEAALEAISSTLKSGQEVQITGFGSFAVVLRNVRRGVHPRTRQAITIPSKWVVRFRPGKQLKKV